MMICKSALIRATAVGVLTAAGLSASAHAAAPNSAGRAAAPAPDAQLLERLQALQAQLAELQARLDAQARAQTATQAQAVEIQSALADTQARVQQLADAAAPAHQKLDDVPTPAPTAVVEPPKSKPSWADQTSVSGRIYYDLSSISQTANGAKLPPSGVGFDIKRLYVGIDHRFNATYSANITTDVQYSSAISSTEVFVKKAYVQANWGDALNLRLGSADLPWIPFVEDLYGYRFVEQVVIDRTKFGTSADWGVHVYGKLGPIFSYAVSAIDGAGYKAPLRSHGMDVEGRLSARYQDFTLAVGGYAGHLGKNTQGATNVFHAASRFNAIAGYSHGPVRLGVEYFDATNWNNVTTVAEDKAEGWSVFGSYAVTTEWSVFGKYDWVKPSKTSAPDKKDVYFNFGLNYAPVRIVDFALVYKRDRVENGTLATSNGTIGGSLKGTYKEVGLFGQVRW